MKKDDERKLTLNKKRFENFQNKPELIFSSDFFWKSYDKAKLDTSTFMFTFDCLLKGLLNVLNSRDFTLTYYNYFEDYCSWCISPNLQVLSIDRSLDDKTILFKLYKKADKKESTYEKCLSNTHLPKFIENEILREKKNLLPITYLPTSEEIEKQHEVYYFLLDLLRIIFKHKELKFKTNNLKLYSSKYNFIYLLIINI